MPTIGDLNQDVLTVLLSHVPARELVLTCRLVCRAWKDLVDKVHIWKRKCLREGYFRRGWDTFPENWMKYYFLRPLMRNLLRNPCAEGEFIFYWVSDVWNWLSELDGVMGFRESRGKLGSYKCRMNGTFGIDSFKKKYIDHRCPSVTKSYSVEAGLRTNMSQLP